MASRDVRDHRGNFIGVIEETSDQIRIRTTRGNFLGYFDKKTQITRRLNGDVYSRGYDATMQLLMEAL
jgi:hypothetical protein